LNKVSYFTRDKQAKIIISCFAMDNFMWMIDHRPPPPMYPMSEWILLSSDSNISEVR
jgi:hypothetical protein